MPIFQKITLTVAISLVVVFGLLVFGYVKGVRILSPIDLGGMRITNLGMSMSDNTEAVNAAYVVSAVQAGGKPVWAGFTPGVYDAYNMGGVGGMNYKCNAVYPGSHACTYDEILKLGTSYPWAGNAWVIDGMVPAGCSYAHNECWYITKDGNKGVRKNSSIDNFNCGGWGNGGITNGGAVTTGSGLSLVNCSEDYRIPCCK